MMICMSCGRRTDPNRSFCTNCGSAVFVSSTEGASRLAPARRSRRDMQPVRGNNEPSAFTPEPEARRSPAQARRPARNAAATAASLAPIFGLIRFSVFLFILWQVGGFLMTVPEVRTAVEATMRGDSETAAAAVEALRRRAEAMLQQIVSQGASSSSGDGSGDTTSRRRRMPPPPPSPVNAPAVDPTLPATADPSAIGSTVPTVIRRVPPVYTEAARRRGIEGSVLLRALVLPDGSVANVSVIRSLDAASGLDRQAVEALRQWRFEPARTNGEPVRAFVQVEMNFTP